MNVSHTYQNAPCQLYYFRTTRVVYKLLWGQDMYNKVSLYVKQLLTIMTYFHLAFDWFMSKLLSNGNKGSLCVLLYGRIYKPLQTVVIGCLNEVIKINYHVNGYNYYNA